MAEPFAFLWRHQLPTLPCAAAKIAVMAAVTAESTEEQAAEDNEPEGLPVADHLPSKEGRQEPIP
jgi:hypothetical protein